MDPFDKSFDYTGGLDDDTAGVAANEEGRFGSGWDTPDLDLPGGDDGYAGGSGPEGLKQDEDPWNDDKDNDGSDEDSDDEGTDDMSGQEHAAFILGLGGAVAQGPRFAEQYVIDHIGQAAFDAILAPVYHTPAFPYIPDLGLDNDCLESIHKNGGGECGWPALDSPDCEAPAEPECECDGFLDDAQNPELDLRSTAAGSYWDVLFYWANHPLFPVAVGEAREASDDTIAASLVNAAWNFLQANDDLVWWLVCLLEGTSDANCIQETLFGDADSVAIVLDDTRDWDNETLVWVEESWLSFEIHINVGAPDWDEFEGRVITENALLVACSVVTLAAALLRALLAACVNDVRAALSGTCIETLFLWAAGVRYPCITQHVDCALPVGAG